MSDEMQLLKHVYDRFNTRDMESVLAAMHDDVVWANGMEGGHVHGRDEVRRYWTHQWATIDPHVDRSSSPMAQPRKSLSKSIRSSVISTATSSRIKWSVTCFESKTV